MTPNIHVRLTFIIPFVGSKIVTIQIGEGVYDVCTDMGIYIGSCKFGVIGSVLGPTGKVAHPFILEVTCVVRWGNMFITRTVTCQKAPRLMCLTIKKWNLDNEMYS